MSRKRGLGWYSVRTLIRVVASGRPKARDRHFDPESTLVEVRVVLFKATGFEDAIEQAENEARRYCRAIRFTNIYGQRVRLKFLGVADAFSMPDHQPSNGCEVYSSTALVARSISDARVIIDRSGKREKGGAHCRVKFIDGRLLIGLELLT